MGVSTLINATTMCNGRRSLRRQGIECFVFRTSVCATNVATCWPRFWPRYASNHCGVRPSQDGSPAHSPFFKASFCTQAVVVDKVLVDAARALLPTPTGEGLG